MLLCLELPQESEREYAMLATERLRNLLPQFLSVGEDIDVRVDRSPCSSVVRLSSKDFGLLTMSEEPNPHREMRMCLDAIFGLSFDIVIFDALRGAVLDRTLAVAHR